MGSTRVRGGRGGHDGPPPDPPGPPHAPQGPDVRDPQPPQALPLRRPVLLLPPRGHILEVRDPAHLPVARVMHPDRVPPPPEIRHEVAAERAPHRRRARVLLAAVRRDPLGGKGRADESAGREVEEGGLSRVVGDLRMAFFFFFQDQICPDQLTRKTKVISANNNCVGFFGLFS